jgi:aspartate/methionine/tyrosine aminotransferase
MPEYTHVHRDRNSDRFHPEDNPDGYIGLCVAESGLMWDELEPWLSGPFDLDPTVAGYGDMAGSVELRTAISRIFERLVFGRPVDADQVVTMAGAGAILEALFRGLADPGEGVLVPTPSYAGFWPDVQTRNDLHIVPVPRTADTGYRLTSDLLERALARAPVPVRAVLYTNPDNPLGSVASESEVLDVIGWTRSHGLHLVSDEIYALSVFGAPEFVSVGRSPLGEDIHVVWGASKDFGMSGLRCGVLVTENEEVRDVMTAQSMWSSVSTHTQAMLARMWADDDFVGRFVTVNRDRLARRWRALSNRLQQAGIAHHPADAGFFTVVDLRSYLADASWEAEQTLWRSVLDHTNVNLTPGSACRSPEPGLFRLCFASVSDEALDAGIGRLVRHLG